MKIEIKHFLSFEVYINRSLGFKEGVRQFKKVILFQVFYSLKFM